MAKTLCYMPSALSPARLPRPPSSLSLPCTLRNQAEQKDWKRRLQKAVDKLRDVLCSCLVADFMYGDDGRSVLTPEEYLQMDDRMRLSQWKQSPLPTPPFQVQLPLCRTIVTTVVAITSLYTRRHP